MTAPTPIAGACAWRGDEMARSTRWIRRLDATAIAEIDTARSAGVPWHETTRGRFPLPGLTVTLAEVARELEDGCGLVTLRGLPVERYTADEFRQIWFGLGNHLGRPVFQMRSGRAAMSRRRISRKPAYSRSRTSGRHSRRGTSRASTISAPIPT